MDGQRWQIAMDELRTWFEVPAIAHYFHVFRNSYSLIDFDIEDFEETLLKDTESDSCFFPDLLICLLQGWFKKKDRVEVTMENYDYYLQDLLNFYNGLIQQECPRFTLAVRYLSPRARVGILYDMINWRLDLKDAMNQTLNLEADEMRVEPVGKDNDGDVYWYFYGSRLYKEGLMVNDDEFPDIYEVRNYTFRKRTLPPSHKNRAVNAHSSSSDSGTETGKSLTVPTSITAALIKNGKSTEREKKPLAFPQSGRPIHKRIIVETSSSFDESEAEDEKSLSELKKGLKKRRKRRPALSKCARAIPKRKTVKNNSSSNESETESERYSEIMDNRYTPCYVTKECVQINHLNDGVRNWSLSCSTLDDWTKLIDNLKDATTRNEKLLLKNLEELFEKIPDIIKERQRKRLKAGRVKVRKKRHREREKITKGRNGVL